MCTRLSVKTVTLPILKRRAETRLEEHKKDVDSIANKAFKRSERKLSQTEFHKGAITDYVAINNHVTSDSRQRESDQRTRLIREAVQPRLHRDVMNRDQGTYRRSHIYDPLFAVVCDGNEGK